MGHENAEAWEKAIFPLRVDISLNYGAVSGERELGKAAYRVGPLPGSPPYVHTPALSTVVVATDQMLDSPFSY